MISFIWYHIGLQQSLYIANQAKILGWMGTINVISRTTVINPNQRSTRRTVTQWLWTQCHCLTEELGESTGCQYGIHSRWTGISWYCILYRTQYLIRYHTRFRMFSELIYTISHTIPWYDIVCDIPYDISRYTLSLCLSNTISSCSVHTWKT